MHPARFFACQNVVIPLLIFLVTSLSIAESPSREKAVTLAKSGELAEAIRQLEILRQHQPNNSTIIDDLIVIYSWDEQYQKACSLFEQRKADSYPVYVQNAAQRSYRNLKQPDQALVIVNHLLEKQPDQPDLLLFKGLLLVDKHELEAAHSVLNIIRDKTEKDSRYYQLSGYLHNVEKKWPAALADYQQLQLLRPQDREPVLEQFSILQNLGAGEAAADLANRQPQWFSDDTHAELLIKRSAARLRWAEHASRNLNETKLLTMQALDMQIKALDLLNREEDKKEWPLSLLNDLVIILHNLRQMEDTAQVYRYLAEQAEVPGYVKFAAADALLTSRHPDKARRLYQQILKQEPYNDQAFNGLFYAFVEEEDFASAYRLIDSAIKKNKPASPVKKNEIRQHNSRYLDLNVYKIMSRSYGNQSEDAWLQIDELVRNAPTNSWLHEIRAQIATARGWPRQALRGYNYAHLLDPENTDITALEASALIQLGQYEQARPLLENIWKNGEETGIQLEKDWRQSRSPQFWSDITYRSVSGSEYHGESITATSDMLSSPIWDKLYIETFCRYAWEQFVEGEESFRRYSLGLDYRLVNWDFSGQATYNDSSLDEFGASMKIIWTPDDFWKLSLSGERFSIDTSMRALYYGIRSDVLNAAMTYRWNERRSLSAGIQEIFFTGKNKGASGTVALTQRLVNIPHINLDGSIELYGSVNSIKDNDAPYFFPEQDFSLAGTLHLDHIYFRHYDKQIKQQFDAGYGSYVQKGYDASWIGHIRYEHVYEYSPWVEIRAGIEIRRNVYDGDPEYYRQIQGMINWKF